MSYLPYVWVYAGATSDEVYAQLDEPIDDTVNLELMSSPQLAFVATDLSHDLVQKLAMDMWSEMQGDYEEAFGRGISFYELKEVMSTKIFQDAVLDGELPVVEVAIWQYFMGHETEPLLRVVVQKRPLHSPKPYRHSA
jgi:hypothetical protein